MKAVSSFAANTNEEGVRKTAFFMKWTTFWGAKKNDRKCVKRGKRDSRFSTSSSDEELRNMSTFKELSPKSESDVNLEQGLQLFNYWSKRLHPLRDNGQWTDFDCVAHNLGSGRWQPDVPNNNFSGKKPAVKLPEQVGRIGESVKRSGREDCTNKKISSASPWNVVEMLPRCSLSSQKNAWQNDRVLRRGKHKHYRICKPFEAIVLQEGSKNSEDPETQGGGRYVLPHREFT